MVEFINLFVDNIEYVAKRNAINSDANLDKEIQIYLDYAVGISKSVEWPCSRRYDRATYV